MITDDYRNIALKALHTLNLPNSDDYTNIENLLYKISTQHNYIDNIYQVINDFYKYNDVNKIINLINENKLCRNNTDFYNYMLEENEQNNFLITPFQIEEGIAECNKCGSKKVFSYQKQSRSCDEPSSTYSQCVVCKNKWVYSG
jgi:DNA-directed RNA polymerase subunit M/transcription elongation factor TFIIS